MYLKYHSIIILIFLILNTNTKICTKLDEIKKTLDDTIYGHEDAKNKYLQFIADKIKNKNNDTCGKNLQGPLV